MYRITRFQQHLLLYTFTWKPMLIERTCSVGKQGSLVDGQVFSIGISQSWYEGMTLNKYWRMELSENNYYALKQPKQIWQWRKNISWRTFIRHILLKYFLNEKDSVYLLMKKLIRQMRKLKVFYLGIRWKRK